MQSHRQASAGRGAGVGAVQDPSTGRSCCGHSLRGALQQLAGSGLVRRGLLLSLLQPFRVPPAHIKLAAQVRTAKRRRGADAIIRITGIAYPPACPPWIWRFWSPFPAAGRWRLTLSLPRASCRGCVARGARVGGRTGNWRGCCSTCCLCWGPCLELNACLGQLGVHGLKGQATGGTKISVGPGT